MTGGDNFLNKYRHMKEEKINKLSDEMILALAYELQFSAMKRLNAMYGECDTLVNEGTPEEDIVTDEVKFAAMKAECNRKAMEILTKDFRWEFDYELLAYNSPETIIFSPNSYGYGENFCFIASSTQIFHNFDLSFGDAVGTLYLCNVIESQK